MKKILIATLICVVTSLSAFAQSGDVMTATHNVYSGITHTYKIAGTDAFEWEVFSNVGCTAAVAEADDTYRFTAGTNLTKNVEITWNEPATAPATYYLRVKQTDGKGCVNYKTLTVVVTSVSTMDFAFVEDKSAGCAVNITGSSVMIEVTLTGDYLVHETGKVAQVQYDVNGTGTPEWIDVDLGATAADIGAGKYTITIPFAKLQSTDPEVSQDFTINVYQLKDGNGAVKDFTGTPVNHTWTANPLPTVDDIQF